MDYIDKLEAELKEFKLRHLFESKEYLDYVENIILQDMRAARSGYSRLGDAESYLKHYKAHNKLGLSLEIIKRRSTEYPNDV
jgi:hypothetical protein